MNNLSSKALYVACTVLSAFCAFMTGGFAMTIIYENVNNKFPAIICTALFAILTVLFMVLSMSYHKDAVREAINNYRKRSLSSFKIS